MHQISDVVFAVRFREPANRLQGKGDVPFGCHLFLPGPQGDELARLEFSGTRSPLFSKSDELVAFSLMDLTGTIIVVWMTVTITTIPPTTTQC